MTFAMLSRLSGIKAWRTMAPMGLRASAHGETKVEQVQLAGFVQDQIAWLEIEVQDSA